jgi:hypothetical protein
MKKLVAAAVLAAFGVAPAVGFACEYNDASMASADPPAQLGLQPAPQASKAPAPTVAAKAVPNAQKQVPDKARAPVEAKMAVATRN